MKIKEYQSQAPRTLNKNLSKDMQILNMGYGLAGETGEVVDLLKKHFFQGHSLNKAKLVEELGDIMFYLCNLATLYEIDMEPVLKNNSAKLALRYPDGFDSEKSIKRENNDRTCSVCKKENLEQGYCVDSGREYYCSDACLLKIYNEKEWEDMYVDGGENYWTEWE